MPSAAHRTTRSVRLLALLPLAAALLAIVTCFVASDLAYRALAPLYSSAPSHLNANSPIILDAVRSLDFWQWIARLATLAPFILGPAGLLLIRLAAAPRSKHAGAPDSNPRPRAMAILRLLARDCLLVTLGATLAYLMSVGANVITYLTPPPGHITFGWFSYAPLKGPMPPGHIWRLVRHVATRVALIAGLLDVTVLVVLAVINRRFELFYAQPR